jgi:hypothetical protein
VFSHGGCTDVDRSAVNLGCNGSSGVPQTSVVSKVRLNYVLKNIEINNVEVMLVFSLTAYFSVYPAVLVGISKVLSNVLLT